MEPDFQTLTAFMSGTVDLFASIHQWCATNLSAFYLSATPYILIAVIVLAFMPLRLFAVQSSVVWRWVMVAMMVLFPLAFVLEMGALLTLGWEVIWWCTPDTYGFWGALWRVFLLILVLVVQFVAMWSFSHSMPGYLGATDPEASFHLSPALWGLVLCYPAFWLAMFLTAYLHLPTSVPVWIFCLVLGAGLLVMFVRNVGHFGWLKAPLACLLGLVVSVGFIVTIAIFLMALAKLTVYALINCPIIGFSFYLQSKYFPAAKPPDPNRMLFYDKDGMAHNTRLEADLRDAAKMRREGKK